MTGALATARRLALGAWLAGMGLALVPRSELEALREDIRKRGIIVPIVVDERRQVIDGQHRLRIALELGLPEDVVPFEIHAGLSDEAREDMAYSLNLCRRHLRPEQRRDVVARLREKRWSTTRIAEVIGVSDDTVRRDLSISANAEIENPSRIDRLGGGTYPSSLPAPFAWGLADGSHADEMFCAACVKETT